MIDSKVIEPLIKAALAEDLGAGDLTSQLLVPREARAQMEFTARQNMVACGIFILAEVYFHLDPSIRVEALVTEGQHVNKGAVLGRVKGNARPILAGERVALNLMQRMSGVATLTAQYVEAVKGTKAVILDTRKTVPGLRLLDKYAVATGGGQNHRMGLHDMVLIKDNHIALCKAPVGALVKQAHAELSLLAAGRPAIPVVVECDTLKQVEEALVAMPDRILLDNMGISMIRKAIKLAAGKAKLEASGGISLKNVRAIAKTGVDYISVGSLTHSAPAADIGADLVAL